MDQSKKIMTAGSLLVFCLLLGVTIFKWAKHGIIDGGSIFFCFLSLSYFLNAVTWGHHEGGGDKDELDEHITKTSAKISYFALMILSALILFVSEGVTNLNSIENFPLLIVVCLTFVILPLTEFIVSRKYK
jgi:hypothetical protein